MTGTPSSLYLVAIWVGGIFVLCVVVGFVITLVVDLPRRATGRRGSRR